MNSKFKDNKNICKLNEKALQLPVKKCHHLEGKDFIVIDKSITQNLNYFTSDNDLYFQQELKEDGSIILRQYKIHD